MKFRCSLSNHSKKLSGVTLIELLVVTAILMIVLGLVGGGTISSVARAMASNEIVALQALIKKSGVKAFTSGGSVSLKFSKSQVQVNVANELRSTEIFKQLYFDDQVIRFSPNGLPDELYLDLAVRDLDRRLDLRPIFDGLLLPLRSEDMDVDF
tara:strand:+ start:31 stop:492 length:462 start_codon:yes stop_codon:yes gene_type:complete